MEKTEERSGLSNSISNIYSHRKNLIQQILEKQFISYETGRFNIYFIEFLKRNEYLTKKEIKVIELFNVPFIAGILKDQTKIKPEDLYMDVKNAPEIRIYKLPENYWKVAEKFFNLILDHKDWLLKREYRRLVGYNNENGGKEKVDVKFCEFCGTECVIKAKYCQECGNEFLI